MADKVEQAAALLRQRVQEIEQERDRLNEALAGLSSGSRFATRPRPAKVGAGHRSRAASKRSTLAPKAKRRGHPKRAQPGERDAQFLTRVRAKPGATIKQVAEAIGVAPKQLYPVARRLEASDQVKRQGPGFVAKKAS